MDSELRHPEPMLSLSKHEGPHSAVVEVDLGAIRHNVAQVRSRLAPGVRLMAVVKADAYGHGAVETSRAMLEAGADALAVTRLEEAARLRQAGIGAPILVFDSIQREACRDAIALDVELTVCAPELVSALREGEAPSEPDCAIGQDRLGRSLALPSAGTLARTEPRPPDSPRPPVRVHLKIDTGMGRLGVLPGEAPALARAIASTEGVALAGTYTHLATAAEKGLSAARDQLRRFREAVDAIRQAEIDPGIVHAANSAAILRLPESHFDMVRPGTILYGQYPSRYVPRALDLRETWRLVAKISSIKTVPAGHPIGYASEFVTRRESKIAVIPLGWADGLTVVPESLARRSILRLLAARISRHPPPWVTVRGDKAPVVGRIAMQMCSIDVTDIPGASVGDEVIVPARRVTTSALLPRVYT